MQIVCPNCEEVPNADVAAGSPCASCGMPLVRVSREEDLSGSVIDGRFEIVSKLGKGGMGTVYRAKQRSIGREVALKVIDRRFEHDVTAVKRFLREAKLASQLSHPNTVGVIEFGQDGNGRLYLAMELVKGRTLYDVLKKEGPFPVPRIVRIGVQLCDALETAHAMSIVHRDLKHENVMVLDGASDRDLIKILDFGLARSLEESEGRATATGIIAGSPRYLAPEVALEAAPPAPAQDLYALGVMLAEIALNRALWDAPTVESLFAMKLHGVPKLDGIEPELRALIIELLGPPKHRPAAAAIRTRLLAMEPSRTLSHAALALDATRQVAAGPPRIESVAAGPPRIASVAAGPPGIESVAAGPPSIESVVAAPTTSDFVPADAAHAALEIEPAWERARQDKRDRASKDKRGGRIDDVQAHKAPLRLFGLLAALIAIAIVATGVVMLVNRKPPVERKLPATEGTVSIEIRSRPTAKIKIDGNTAGSTPLTLHVPKSGKSVMIEATMPAHPILTKQAIPDHDQMIDFP